MVASQNRPTHVIVGSMKCPWTAKLVAETAEEPGVFFLDVDLANASGDPNLMNNPLIQHAPAFPTTHVMSRTGNYYIPGVVAGFVPRAEWRKQTAAAR